MAWDWRRIRKPREGNSFGRPSSTAATAAQRWADDGYCSAGFKHRGRCRHR